MDTIIKKIILRYNNPMNWRDNGPLAYCNYKTGFGGEALFNP